MNKPIVGFLIVAVLLIFGGFGVEAGVVDQDLEDRLASVQPDEEVSVIVTFSGQVDVRQFKDPDKGLRRFRLVKALKALAEKDQKPIKDFLKQAKAKKITSFWIFNGLAVTAPAGVIVDLAAQPGVKSVRLDGKVVLPEPAPASSALPEWNVSMIGAPELWDLGFTGAGTVVANMDTGVDPYHPDLAAKWRGGSNSWFDPNGQHAAPYDANGHGTQTMGIMVGGSAGGTAIGIAPGAQWIAVKIFNDAGSASYSAIHQGFQWLLDPDGNSQTDDAPDVVNNSWGFETAAGQCFAEFEADVGALRAAGIAVVFSAGNRGPSANTSVSPANYSESFAVGAVDGAAGLAYFSSRGPSACDGDFYPEVVAPGVNVKTADLSYGGARPNAYAYVSGTSFAAPHVAGAMALLVSAFSGLTIADMEDAITQSAYDLGGAGPDNEYGYGLIDVAAAYALLGENPPLCTDTDNDGFYAETGCGTPLDCNDGNGSVYPGASEIKHDGVDQDCNGYDLTIDIIKASYTAKRDTLAVEATSDLRKNAGLVLVGYGPMKWDNRKLKWSISVKGAGGDPGSVTVSGVEGSESAATAR